MVAKRIPDLGRCFKQKPERPFKGHEHALASVVTVIGVIDEFGIVQFCRTMMAGFRNPHSEVLELAAPILERDETSVEPWSVDAAP